MDALTFTVELSKALAWPMAVFVTSLLFRPQIIKLLESIKSGKVGPASFEFERTVNAIAATVADLPPSPTQHTVFREAVVNPRAVILEAWLELEEKAYELALSAGLVRPTARRHAFGAIKSLQKSNLLEAKHLNALRQLQMLRNSAAHDPDFSPDPNSVIAYVQLAADLSQELETLKQ